MPDKLYSLDREGKQILDVSWKRNFTNLELNLNNKLLGKIKSRQELLQGKEFKISHDKRLSVRLIREMYLFTVLELLVNGFPVEKSMTHPVKKLIEIFLLIIIIAVINLIIGLLGLIADEGFFRRMGAGFWNIIYAGIFILLGMMMKEKKSLFAMISMIVLMVLDIISSFLFLMEAAGQIHFVGPILVKAFLTVYLFRGVKAIKEFKKMEEEMALLKKAEEEKKLQTPLSQQVTEDHSRFMPGDHSAYMPGGGG
ncbi:MAG TPA: hypothetical protein VJ346_00450 [Bacteroidales bacterium]|nr:hypothetical protein [Bacteroidales bacterium]